jgi:hypothetical protein
MVPAESQIPHEDELGFHHRMDKATKPLSHDEARAWLAACMSRGNCRIENQNEADALLS